MLSPQRRRGVAGNAEQTSVYTFALVKVFLIIPAAGMGTRMTATKGRKAPVSKQFLELAGAPIIVHTLRRFLENRRISEVFIALRKAEAEAFQPRLAKEKFKQPVHLLEGGENRQESVSNALKAVAKVAAADDVVLVHDAVRPFVEPEVIENVIETVIKSGAAIAGVPAIDTIKQVERTAEGAIITSTIPRERIVQAQTPQGFRFSLLQKAFDDAAAIGFTGTDEASLVERIGGQVSVVMGSARNIKITTPADLELAEFFLEQENRSLAG